MAATHVTVVLVDEGYYSKFFQISVNTPLKKLLDAYRSHLCRSCSNPALLAFWFETNQIKDTDTASGLKLGNGDRIDVRIPPPITRGACPVPPEQTIPNIHYLALPPSTPRTAAGPSHPSLPTRPSSNRGGLFLTPPPAVLETAPIPTNTASDERITINVRDTDNLTLQLRIKKTTQFRKVLEAYARQAKRDPREFRMFTDGERITGQQTPAEVEMIDGDWVEVFTEQLGGGGDGVVTGMMRR